MMKGLIIAWLTVCCVGDALGAVTPMPLPSCVRGCQGQPISIRPDCDDCSIFHVCANGVTYNLTCPPGTLYDRDQGRCEHAGAARCGTLSSAQAAVVPGPPPVSQPAPPNPMTSVTGSIGSQGTGSGISGGTGSVGNCIRSCDNMDDGDYQSCQGCHVYASCVAGRLTDARMCAMGTVWDDSIKRCNYTSTTCHSQQRKRRQTETGRWMDPSMSLLPLYSVTSRCFNDCQGKTIGMYQSCEACSSYLLCTDGVTQVNRCQTGFQFDSAAFSCMPVSTTCTEGYDPPVPR